MAQSINDNFRVLAALPIDDRYFKQTINDRNNIEVNRRYQGLLCYVLQTSTLYILKGGIDNTFWEEFGGGGQSNGFVIHEGVNDPNVNPPSTYAIGDWYIQNANMLYQYNGSEWVLLQGGTPTEILIDDHPFRYVRGLNNTGDGVVNGDIASGGVFTYQGNNFFGDLILVDALADISTGIGTTWEIINRTQI